MIQKNKRLLLQSLDIYKKVCFEFDDGWVDLLYTLGLDITLLCRTDNIPLPKVLQIKEKFGTLRFYYQDKTANDKLRDLVIKAERESEYICEKCGKQGETCIDTSGVWQTVCSEHQPLNGFKTVVEFTNAK